MSWARHPAVLAALTALTVAGAWVGLRSELGNGEAEKLERQTLDLRFRVRGQVAPGPEVAMVVFDDATAAHDPELFTRYAGWAKVIRAAHAAGAKVVGVDAAFEVPEQLLGPALGARVAAWSAAHPQPEPDDADGQLLAEVARALDGDAQLAGALRQSGFTVLAVFSRPGAFAPPTDPALARARYGQSTPGASTPQTLEALLASRPIFTAAARGMGVASLSEDQTRTIRRVPMVYAHGEGAWLPFAVPIVAGYLGVNRGAVAWLGPQQQVKVGERTFQAQRDALWLNYRGPRGTFPTYSAADLVEGKVPAGALAGKIVLLGVTRIEYDLVRGPFGAGPGVEVQATIIDNLLRGDPLRRTERLTDLLATFGLGLLVALLFTARRLGPVAQIAGALALTAGWLLACFLAFRGASLWLPCVAPAAAAVASAAVGLTFSYSAEVLKRRTLKRAFAHYLGEDALEQLLKDPSGLELGGERRNLTVLFSDICGFTTLSEQLAPEKLVAFLNTYLSPMTRAVLARGGLLDKYIGDAVMAVFGAPVLQDDHPRQALLCVLTMHRDLEALNQGALKALGLDVAIGVGVNTGEMVVGNMGSEDRFDYTVAGDAVNLASRLEGLTRTYGVFCLVGEATRAAAGEGFTFRELDQVQVKGKLQAVAVFELLSGPGRSVAAPAALDAWERALAAWRQGRLADARRAFGAFAQANPTDVPCRLYLERLAELPESAPEGFSPVAVFKSK